MCAKSHDRRSDLPRTEQWFPLEEPLSLEAVRRIDAVCLAFEDVWKSDASPRLEDYLGTAAGAERAALLRELLCLDLDYRRRRGQQPTTDEYLARFPDLGSAIAAAFAHSAHESPGAFEEAEIPLGKRLDRYLIERQLGWGGFSSVYLAWDEKLQRHVAIKVPRWRQKASDEELHRYLEEARIVAKLHHPGIAVVFDAGRTDDGIPYIVSQYIDGSSLKQWLEENRPTPAYTAELLADVSVAVHFAHRRGFVHRDLKPGNILFDSQGKPYVVDFGLALHESVQRGRAGESAGTISYMSPEQVRGETHQLDGRTDIWTLGVILYEMLTGRQPFQGETPDQLTEEILHRPAKPPRQIDEQTPEALERICLKCLAKRPEDRYATSQDLARDLRRALHPRRSWAWITTAGVVAGVLIVLAAWQLGRYFGGDSQGANPLAAQIQPGPLTSKIDVIVWDPEDSARRRLNIRDFGALPLQTNDQVRIEAELDRPMYVYILWIDSQGEVQPMYPWQPGHWDKRPANETPRCRLALPAQLDRGWELGGPAGMETVVLLARQTPLPQDFSIPAQLAELKRQPQLWQSPQSLAEFDAGKVIAAARNHDRGLKSFDPTRINDPVLQTQRLLAEKLLPHFSTVRAVSFANQGE